MEEKRVKLIAADGQSFIVLQKEAEVMGMVKDILEERIDDDEVPEIPLPSVKDGSTLKHVLDYCKYHWNKQAKEIEKPLKGKVENHICDWDKEYLKKPLDVKSRIVNAANYLKALDLLELMCASFASMMKGQSVEEIRMTFGIENDFTTDEEDKIREENKWCCES